MKILSLAFILLIASCVEKKPGTNILTSGIFNQALYSINGKDASGKTIELGEHLLTNPPLKLEVRVYNGTNYDYTELDLSFSVPGENSPSTNYLPSPEGGVDFPGFGGTCQRKLAPKASCIIFLEINPREERVYNELIKLSYKQYVELEEHTATVQFLAGMPASLIFTNDRTQYQFGTPAGPNLNPVVERADAEPHFQEFEIKNAGGLSATNIVMELDEACTSTLTQNCPTGMFGAYRMEHNCPSALAPGETCQVQIFYKPLNTDPISGPVPQEIKEINYRATVSARYTTDSSGKQAAINAYFNSFSTDIQAKFTTSNSTVIFDQEVISGNRETRFVTVRNVGYRTGYLEYLTFHNPSDNFLANCYKGDTSYLECVDLSATPVALSTLPFRIKDRHGCLSDATTKVEIQVNQACIFDVYFQPSVTFLNDMTAEFQGMKLNVTYDALYKNVSTITSALLSNISAKSISAARVIIEKIRYDGVDYYTSSDGQPSLANLGRITIQAPAYAVYKNLMITFKNIGHTRASNITLRDGLNRPIAIGGAGTNIGVKEPYFYKTVLASDSTCSFIEPEGQCSVTMSYAAVGMASNAEEDANMFDTTDALNRKIKQFILSYKSGALYTDENIDSPADYPTQESQAQITAHLVRKGMLMELADDARNLSNFEGAAASVNDEVITYLYLRNIGTGDLTYIQALNPADSSTLDSTWTLIPTTDPTSLGAQYDCLNIVDTKLSGAINATVDPNLRIGQFASLPPGESCVYTVRIKSPDTTKHMNSYSCGTSITRQEEAMRLYYKDGTTDLWEVCRNRSGLQWQNIKFRYFDGDLTAATPDHPDYGNQFQTKNHTMDINRSWSRKFTFYSYAPFLTATSYRPAFTLPDLATGSSTQGTKAIPAAWFYGTSTLYFSKEVESLNTSPFIKAAQSRHPAQGMSLFANYSDYDYVYYAGAFPRNAGIIDFAPGLINNGSHQTTIRTITKTPLTVPTAPATTLSITTTTPMPRTVNANNSYTLNYQINTNTAAIGEHAYAVEMDYETGDHLIPVIYKSTQTPSNSAALASNKKMRKIKFLILAKVLDTPDHPKLSLETTDYEVVGNEGAPPTVTALPPVATNLTWNQTTASSTLIFESVKIPNVPTVNDVYAKKTLRLRNNSNQPLYELDFKFRTAANSSIVTTIASTFNQIPAESTCLTGMTLNVGASCTITFRYQPKTADINANYHLTFVYRSAAREFFMENVAISLMPKSPGKLVAVGKSLQTINYKPAPTSGAIIRDSYRLQFPTTELTAIPTEINFTAESGALSKIELENQEETKASLLLAYQKYLSKNNLRGFSEASPAGSSVVPQEIEYITRPDGHQYAPIYASTYLSAEASRYCFFGDDEANGAIPSHQKGFNKFSVNSCYLRFYLRANFDYLNKQITNIDGDAMRDHAFELWYYSVSRSSSAYTWFHFVGTILPNPSVMIGNYGDVQALDTKVITASTPTFSPSHVSLGGVSGIRVYLSDNKSMLDNIYLTPPTTYFDIRTSVGGKWIANFNSGLQNNKFYYMKATAIRYDARFNYTAERFPGLSAGEYISQASATPTLSVVVPPTGHYYVHSKKAILDKNITGTVGNYDWNVSSAKCTARSASFKTPDNVSFQYKLMNSDVWEVVKPIPTAHGYSNYLSVTHWLSNPLVNIVDYAGISPSYNPGSNSQTLTDIKVYYFRDSANRDNPVRTIVGGVIGTGYSDYYSYVAPSLPFGNARCMISLE